MSKIAVDKLRGDPYIINKKTWYYEEPKGIEVIHHRGPDDYIHVVIPWFKLRRSVERAYNIQENTND